MQYTFVALVSLVWCSGISVASNGAINRVDGVNPSVVIMTYFQKYQKVSTAESA